MTRQYPSFVTSISDDAFRIGLVGKMGTDMHRDFPAVLDDAEQSEAPVIVLYGTGTDFLVAPGEDLVDAVTQDLAALIDVVRHGEDLVRALIEVRKPIVAMVNGNAVGTGVTIMLLADFVVASEDAKFLDAHVRNGVPCGDGAAFLWPALIGLRKTKEILMLSTELTASQAAELGLINRAVPRHALETETAAIVGQLAALPRLGLSYTRWALNGWLRMGAGAMLHEGLAVEALSVAASTAHLREVANRGLAEPT